MSTKRVPVDFTLDRLRRHLGVFETAWEKLTPMGRRVLVLRCGGMMHRQVADELSISLNTAKNHAASVIRTMNDATDEGEFLAICWLYGYSRALQDIDEQLARKKSQKPVMADRKQPRLIEQP